MGANKREEQLRQIIESIRLVAEEVASVSAGGPHIVSFAEAIQQLIAEGLEAMAPKSNIILPRDN